MTERRNGADLVVVGGGVIGLSVAREARARGMQVTVVERGRPGREASWAAAGMLSPLGEALEPGPFLRFGLESLEAYPDFAAELEEETGIPVEHRRCGKLRVALSEPEKERLLGRHRWAVEQGFSARWLAPEAIRTSEPALCTPVRGGLLLDEDHRVDGRALMEALIRSVRQRQTRLLEGSEVRAVEAAKGRARGIVLKSGIRIEADAVLVAAGAWSGRLEGLPTPLPVRPVRGQMLCLRPQTLPSARVLESEEGYLVPRDDGRLLVGATVEEAGFERGVTAGGVRSLLDAALRLVPGLASAPVSESWAGFRPGTPDGLPILGEHPEVEGLFVATGHFRNGILLAPATARTMGALVAGDPDASPPSEFGVHRFLDASV